MSHEGAHVDTTYKPPLSTPRLDAERPTAGSKACCIVCHCELTLATSKGRQLCADCNRLEVFTPSEKPQRERVAGNWVDEGLAARDAAHSELQAAAVRYARTFTRDERQHADDLANVRANLDVANRVIEELRAELATAKENFRVASDLALRERDITSDLLTCFEKLRQLAGDWLRYEAHTPLARELLAVISNPPERQIVPEGFTFAGRGWLMGSAVELDTHGESDDSTPFVYLSPVGIRGVPKAGQ